MEIHYSDYLIWLFKDLGADVTETPYGIKIIEYAYADDKMAIFILSNENEIITYHFE